MRLSLGLLISTLPAAVTEAAPPPFACTDYTRGMVCLVSAEGKVEWEYPATNCNDLRTISSVHIRDGAGAPVPAENLH